MPEIDASEHPHGQIGAPPAGGLAVATPAIPDVSRSSANDSTAAEPRTAGSERTVSAGRVGSGPGPAGERRGRRLSVVLEYLDVVLVVVAVPVALALGAPAFGVLVAAIAWIAQRALAAADKRLVSRAAEPRTRLGLSLFEAFGRIWLLAGTIILAGVVGGRADGLTAALMTFAAYSVAFAVKLLTGRPSPPAREAVR